jgi:alcohol dehydrogenase (cytochrome c)
MKRLVVLVACGIAAATLLVRAQGGLDPKTLLNPGTDSWPTYNGDYSGRRFSALKKIDTNNVSGLSLAWVYRLNLGSAPVVGSSATIKSTPLQINGVLYFSTPDNAWAVDARTGREIWHYIWKSQGGNHLSNRGVAVLGDWLYFETPDDHLICLSIKDGKERWHQTTADLNQFYYSSTAPVIVKNHVITGVSGDDLDIPGYLDARDPETGELQWRWYSVPQKKGDPGFETWPNEDMARHGGGMTWQPITYDPELNLIYVATGNPQPVMAHVNRPGANLFTASIVALNADMGKMVWYFQPSPHDTHDWDATEPAVLFDGTINGRPRKLLAQASRNGHFFVLDRTDGKAIVQSRDGAVLRPRLALLCHVLPLRSEREPARVGGQRARRLCGVDDPGDRLPDWKDPLEPQVGRPRAVGAAQHGRQSPLHRRAGQLARRAQRDDR